MTTIAMFIGILPIALASGAGAERKNGPAWVIIGSLVSSLFLTFVVVPVMYAIFNRMIAHVQPGKNKLSINDLMIEHYELKPHHEHSLNPSPVYYK